VAPAAGEYKPLTETRIVDSRSGLGTPSGAAGALPPNTQWDVAVAGTGGVPSSGVLAVALNVTTVSSTATGAYLTAWATGQAKPSTSTLNENATVSVDNLAIVPLGTGGKVSFWQSFSGSTHLLVDVVGYVTDSTSTSAAGTYAPLTAARVFDTRTGAGGVSSPIGSGATISETVTGVGGVPSSGVIAVALNVGTVNASASSYVTAWAAGDPRPAVSSIQTVSGQAVQKLLVVPVGTGGKISLYSRSGTVDVFGDVVGYYLDPTGPGSGDTFVPVTPKRLLDTRNGTGGISAPLGAGGVGSVKVTGVAGLPTLGVDAVVVNLATVNGTAASYVTAYKYATTRPAASTVQVSVGMTQSNLAFVPVSADGKFTVYNAVGSTDLVGDVTGYFRRNTAPGAISRKEIQGGVTGSPWLTSTVTPRLTAAAADPDVDKLRYDFEVYAGTSASPAGPPVAASPTSGVAPSVPSGQAGTWTVPASAGLANRSSYEFRVRASDGPLAGSWSAYLPFTVDTTAPTAPTITSDVYSAGGWTETGGAATFSFAGSDSSGSGVDHYLWGLDATTPTTATASGVSTAAITPGDGWHTLTVQTVDRAGNPSAAATFSFGAQPAVTAPQPGLSVQRTTTLTARAAPGYTRATYLYRRSQNTADWTPIPDGDLATSGGAPVTQPVAVPSGGDSRPPALTWNTASTLGEVDGPAQLRVCFDTGPSTASTCSGSPVGITLDTRAFGDGYASADVGPGSVNLLTGNLTVNDSDVSVDGYDSDLTLSRTFNSSDPNANPVDAPQQLPAAVQDAETGDASDLTAARVTVAASTDRAFTAAHSWALTSTGGTSTGDSYAAVGGGSGELRLGMTAGRTYTATGRIYVPAATGLSPDHASRGLRIVAFTRVGTGPYVETASNAPTATGSWQRLSVTFPVPAGATEAFLRLYNGFAAAGKTVYYDTASLTARGVLGPGWTANLPVDAASADYTGLVDTGATVTVGHADGSSTAFARAGSGYRPTGDDTGSGFMLTAGGTAAGANGPADFTFTDLDGNTATFAAVYTDKTGGSATPNAFGAPPALGTPHPYRLQSVASPGTGQTTSFDYLPDGRPDLETAPRPPGVTGCTNWAGAAPTGAQWPAGCRGLKFGYDPTTLQLSSVTLVTNPGSGPLLVDVACYSYSSAGRLTAEWDPRTGTPATGSHPIACGAPNLATSYSYDSAGRLATITPPGLAATTVGYDSAGRLATLTRTHDSAHGGGSETSTVVYDVPLTADPDQPSYRPAMRAADVAAWAQQDTPVRAVAVYGPGDTASGSDLRDGQVHYLDLAGREVNTASYAGSGADGWHLATTEYDEHDNVIRSLDPANREEALSPTGAAGVALGLPADPAAAARQLDTVTRYTTDPADGVTDLTDSYGPYHRITLPDGSVSAARAHAHTDYDTGTETGHPTSPAHLHLPVRQTVTASRGPDPTPTSETDSRTTTTDYALSSTDATGWTFRAPMRVVTDPDGVASTSITRYDPDTGAVIEARMPNNPSGGGAGSTVTSYYTARANSTDSACGNHPEWAGLACTVAPAGAAGGAAAGLPGLVTTRTTGYDYLNRPTTVVETVTDAGGTPRSRTTSTGYDTSGYADRVKTGSVTGGAPGETPLPDSVTSYSASTGLPTAVAAGTGSSAPSATTSYDDFGRVTSYIDDTTATGGNANTTTTSYDRAGRVAATSDAHTTRTYGYNGGGEHRGLPTSLTVTVNAATPYSGSFTASYDPTGDLAATTYPNGVTSSVSQDEVGQTLALQDTASGGGTWLTDTETADITGNRRTRALSGASGGVSSQTYNYDPLGRLNRVEDTTGTAGCTTRDYTFNANSNRTSLTTYPANSGDGSCQHTTNASTVSHSYDTADRLQPTGVDSGLSYDAFGRTTTLPAADSIGAGGDTTLSYYTNDLVRSQTQGSRTLTWTLDAAQRLRTRTDTANTAADKTNHYDSNSSDSPGWISENSTGSAWTANIQGLDGNLALTIDQPGAVITNLASLDGNIVGTVAASDSNPSYNDTDEYGIPRDTSGSLPRYAWLGGKQRSGDDLAGLILMGVRLYQPTLGRFLQTDPIPGGSANVYDYAGQDPLNHEDPMGTRWVLKYYWQTIARGYCNGECYLPYARTGNVSAWSTLPTISNIRAVFECLGVGTGCHVGAYMSTGGHRTSGQWSLLFYGQVHTFYWKAGASTAFSLHFYDFTWFNGPTSPYPGQSFGYVWIQRLMYDWVWV
jgi:RHS repeat-associated protein